MKQSLLLLKDVYGLGKKGEIVAAKPGYARNFLLPQKMALHASKQTLELQKRLQEEREKQAAEDRVEAAKIAATLKEEKLLIKVKVDVEGNLYGSVTVYDISHLLKEKGYEIDKKNVLIAKPLKKLGQYTIDLRLQEDVPATVTLDIEPEDGSVIRKPIDAMKRDAELDKEEEKEAEEDNEQLAEEAKSE
jgi:large subunit ribosomal protein L9